MSVLDEPIKSTRDMESGRKKIGDGGLLQLRLDDCAKVVA